MQSWTDEEKQIFMECLQMITDEEFYNLKRQLDNMYQQSDTNRRTCMTISTLVVDEDMAHGKGHVGVASTTHLRRFAKL